MAQPVVTVLVILGVVIKGIPWAAKQVTEAVKILKETSWEVADARHEKARAAKALADRQAKQQARQQANEEISMLGVFGHTRPGNNGDSKARSVMNSH
jgi:Sec-independent protein translocase protein TatA